MKLAIVKIDVVIYRLEEIGLTPKGQFLIEQLKSGQWNIVMVGSVKPWQNAAVDQQVEKYEAVLRALTGVRAIYFNADTPGNTCYCVYRPNKDTRHPEDVADVISTAVHESVLGKAFRGKFKGSEIIEFLRDVYSEAETLLIVSREGWEISHADSLVLPTDEQIN